MTKKTQEKYDTILAAMKPEIWYKSSDFENILILNKSQIAKLCLSNLTLSKFNR